MTTPPVQPPLPQNPYAQPVPPQYAPPAPAHAGAPAYPQQYGQQQYAPPAPQPAPPMGYGPSCRFCGAVPAVEATIRGHQGFIVVMRFLKLRGPFCRRCGIAAHRDMTAKSMWQGWWGVGSMIINPITMLINLGQRSKINRLPEPIPGGPGTPMDPGKPIFRRPAALVLLVPVAAFALFATMIVVGAQSDPQYASVGECVHNSGSYSSPNMTVTDCSSSDADYEIVGKLDDTTDDSGCKAFARSTVSYYEEYGSSKYVLCLASKS